MATKQIIVYLCVDQHGNYRAMGSNQITAANLGQAIAIIEDDLKKEGVTTITTTINAVVNLPDEPVQAEPITEPVVEPERQND